MPSLALDEQIAAIRASSPKGDRTMNPPDLETKALSNLPLLSSSVILSYAHKG